MKKKAPVKMMRGGKVTAQPKPTKMMRGGTTTAKKKMAMGGMNTAQAGGGRALQQVDSSKAGLKKLPTNVRNRMGYMSRGGKATKKK